MTDVRPVTNVRDKYCPDTKYELKEEKFINKQR